MDSRLSRLADQNNLLTEEIALLQRREEESKQAWETSVPLESYTQATEALTEARAELEGLRPRLAEAEKQVSLLRAQKVHIEKEAKERETEVAAIKKVSTPRSDWVALQRKATHEAVLLTSFIPGGTGNLPSFANHGGVTKLAEREQKADAEKEKVEAALAATAELVAPEKAAGVSDTTMQKASFTAAAAAAAGKASRTGAAETLLLEAAKAEADALSEASAPREPVAALSLHPRSLTSTSALCSQLIAAWSELAEARYRTPCEDAFFAWPGDAPHLPVYLRLPRQLSIGVRLKNRRLTKAVTEAIVRDFWVFYYAFRSKEAGANASELLTRNATRRPLESIFTVGKEKKEASGSPENGGGGSMTQGSPETPAEPGSNAAALFGRSSRAMKRRSSLGSMPVKRRAGSRRRPPARAAGARCAVARSRCSSMWARRRPPSRKRPPALRSDSSAAGCCAPRRCAPARHPPSWSSASSGRRRRSPRRSTARRPRRSTSRSAVYGLGVGPHGVELHLPALTSKRPQAQRGTQYRQSQRERERR